MKKKPTTRCGSEIKSKNTKINKRIASQEGPQTAETTRSAERQVVSNGELLSADQLIKLVRPTNTQRSIREEQKRIAAKLTGMDMGEVYDLLMEMDYWSTFCDGHFAKSYALALLDYFQSAGQERTKLTPTEVAKWNSVFTKFMAEDDPWKLRRICSEVFDLLHEYDPSIWPPSSDTRYRYQIGMMFRTRFG